MLLLRSSQSHIYAHHLPHVPPAHGFVVACSLASDQGFRLLLTGCSAATVAEQITRPLRPRRCESQLQRIPSSRQARAHQSWTAMRLCASMASQARGFGAGRARIVTGRCTSGTLPRSLPTKCAAPSFSDPVLWRFHSRSTPSQARETVQGSESSLGLVACMRRQLGLWGNGSTWAPPVGRSITSNVSIAPVCLYSLLGKIMEIEEGVSSCNQLIYMGSLNFVKRRCAE